MKLLRIKYLTPKTHGRIIKKSLIKILCSLTNSIWIIYDHRILIQVFDMKHFPPLKFILAMTSASGPALFIVVLNFILFILIYNIQAKDYIYENKFKNGNISLYELNNLLKLLLTLAMYPTFWFRHISRNLGFKWWFWFIERKMLRKED